MLLSLHGAATAGIGGNWSGQALLLANKIMRLKINPAPRVAQKWGSKRGWEQKKGRHQQLSRMPASAKQGTGREWCGVPTMVTQSAAQKEDGLHHGKGKGEDHLHSSHGVVMMHALTRGEDTPTSFANFSLLHAVFFSSCTAKAIKRHRIEAFCAGKSEGRKKNEETAGTAALLRDSHSLIFTAIFPVLGESVYTRLLRPAASWDSRDSYWAGALAPSVWLWLAAARVGGGHTAGALCSRGKKAKRAKRMSQKARSKQKTPEFSFFPLFFLFFFFDITPTSERLARACNCNGPWLLVHSLFSYCGRGKRLADPVQPTNQKVVFGCWAMDGLRRISASDGECRDGVLRFTRAVAISEYFHKNTDYECRQIGKLDN